MKTPNVMTNKPLETYSPQELANKLKLSEKVIANHALQLDILVTLASGEQYVEVANIGKLMKALKKNYAQTLKVDGVGEKLEKLAEYALEQQAIAKAKESAMLLKEQEEQQLKEQEQLKREEELKQVDHNTGLPLRLLELTKAVLSPTNFHCGTFSFLRQLLYAVEANIRMTPLAKPLHELYPQLYACASCDDLRDNRSMSGKLKPQDFRGLHNYSGNKEDVSFSLSETQKEVFYEYLSLASEGIEGFPSNYKHLEKEGLPETVRVIAAVDKWEVPLSVPMLEKWRLEGVRLKEERRLRLEAYALQAHP